MARSHSVLSLIGFLGIVFPMSAVQFDREVWPAHWISMPGAAPQTYGVYHFRKAFDLSATPAHLMVFVSGDNRYQLFVNGRRVSWGPARSDLTHWRYETVNLAPFLQAGQNTLAAVVWNEGGSRAVAQITNETGFLLQAQDEAYSFLNSGKSWKALQDRAYQAQAWPANERTGYFALGPNERLDGKAYPWGWETANFDDAGWTAAAEIGPGAPRAASDSPNRWMLSPREIPLEEIQPERLAALRESSSINVPSTFPTERIPVEVPPHTHVRLLLDQSHLTTAYPELIVSRGSGAQVTLRYAESLYKPREGRNPLEKGNRNEVHGKVIYGPADTFIADGGRDRLYRPLFWRTFRYLELLVDTQDEPLTIVDLQSEFTSYPFLRKASLTVSDPAVNAFLQRVLDTGWHTARLCAHETYMDCPFYEQLEYAGDTRIQALVSLYMTGDRRLARNAIELLDSSRTAEGATLSRAPSGLQQYIPPFALWWIGMLHDYWMYTDDEAFVRRMLPGVEAVLSFFHSYQAADGMLGRLPWWNFVDWARQWQGGVPPTDADGGPGAAVHLQLLLAYHWAAQLAQANGAPYLAVEYQKRAQLLADSLTRRYWDATRQLFADEASHTTYSQQVNTLAVLAGLVPTGAQTGFVHALLTDSTLTQSTIYFDAYTNAALRETGSGDQYLNRLGPWREMLNEGLTTWAEWAGSDTRSDCHAWSASPNYELFRTVAGIESAAPAFRKVRIAPNLGNLDWLRATVPHPNGAITISLRKKGNRLDADIELPEGVDGELKWGAGTRTLKTGRNHVAIEKSPD